MRKKNGKFNAKICFICISSVALIVAILSASIAWFDIPKEIEANDGHFKAAEDNSLTVEIDDVLDTFDKYLGQTGIQYQGDDAPYYIEYSPAKFTYSSGKDEDQFLRYYFDTETSGVQRFGEGSVDLIGEASLWTNFVMNLITIEPVTDAETGDPAVDDEGNSVYAETGEEYWGENGFFRNSRTGELLKLDKGLNLFKLRIYFQGDVGYHLLQETQADIPERYTFEFSDESYMFSIFHLNAVFQTIEQNSLYFSTTPLDENYEDISSRKSVSVEKIAFTGFSLLDPYGNAQSLPVPEIYESGNNSVVDYSYYFCDWAYMLKGENESVTPYIYRSEKGENTDDNVVTLQMFPLRKQNETLNSKWKISRSLIFDSQTDAEDITAYVRPDTDYYQGEGYAVYDPTTKSVKIYNPTTDGFALAYTINAPTREGYHFMGWSEKKLGTIVGNNADYAFTETNGYTYKLSQDTVLYAVWKEIGVNVTFAVNETWGLDYATVSGGTVTVFGETFTIGSDNAPIEIAKHTDLTTITATATALINATGENRGLTLDYWTYYDEASRQYVKVTKDFDLIDDITLYPVWKERTKISVKLDIFMDGTIPCYGKFTINEPINLDHFTVLIDGSATGTFGSQEGNDVVLTVQEGTKLSELSIEITPYSGLTEANTYKFDNWYLNADNDKSVLGNWGDDNGTVYDVNSYIDSDIKLYMRIKSKLST